jgi:hypothetical protein
VRMPAPDCRSDSSVEGSEPQIILPLMPEHEGDALRTEPALTIVEQQGTSHPRTLV